MALTTKVKKKLMLEALKATMGIVSQAAEQAGISRSVHYKWMLNDKKYKQEVEEGTEVKKDFIESKLIQLIQKDDPRAVIFAAETQLKDRGYVRRSEVTGKGGAPLQGLIKHEVDFINSKQAVPDAPEQEAKEDQA